MLSDKEREALEIQDRRISVEEIQEQYYVSKDKIKSKIKECREILNNSIYINNFENDDMLYDYIYFIQQRKKHTSGYKFKCDYLHCSSFRIEIVKE